MQADLRFKIISEGQKNGISETCRQHGISRTLYYRWLKRYKTHGLKGLEDVEKQFVPVNKTPPEITQTCLNLIKNHPVLGPREIKYRLEDIGYDISESAVYNIMKRHQLTQRAQRLKFSRRKDKKITNSFPELDTLESGSCWLFWITHYGTLSGIGDVYEYTIFDYKSRIACTRLYPTVSLSHFIELLTAVAIPVGQTLNFNIKHLCFFDDYGLKEKNRDQIVNDIHQTVRNCGFDISIHMIPSTSDVKALTQLREAYTRYCLGYLTPYIHRNLALRDLKLRLQSHIRDYNISTQIEFEDFKGSPIEYHIHLTNTPMILPLWAYIDREY